MNAWDLMELERAHAVVPRLSWDEHEFDAEPSIDAALYAQLPTSAVGLLVLWHACASLCQLATSRVMRAWRALVDRHALAGIDDLRRSADTTRRTLS